MSSKHCNCGNGACGHNDACLNAAYLRGRKLRSLLELLPGPKGDEYFELRKQDEWVCALTNRSTNKEICNNVGSTPEIAVQKMLDRLGIKA